MKTSKRIRYSISITILAVSAFFWIILLFNPGGIMTVKHCHVSLEGPSKASLQMMLQMNPVSDLMIGWTLMVLAMMLPKLITPVQYIYDRSFKSRRFWSALLFILGYTAVWIVMGFFMNAIIVGLNLLLPNSYIPALAVGIIAVIWQFSPIKQKCLNRGHDHVALAAFGSEADRDAFMFGIMHGVWCVGAGWALMLFPMLLPSGHNLAMIVVTFIMISEHMEHPRSPGWHFSFRLKLLRVMIAQTRLNMKNILKFN
ncbi:Predicted metal-binding integral membrane protein [Chryseobacterium oleae]|uniref:Predicted metal-binding integral membrane protein n=1 Tax=Chryseobacterium oleae TaxID=491207 RepID=A0A1I4ZT51_CHROL|nr:DUF2182 domain-containing protein [Chryseobacterium oleae]SFN53233.1 Predicted metal-binding integral membrane protein [Chryseobacterium oleae]